MQGAETRLPFWGRWFAIGKPERAGTLSRSRLRTSRACFTGNKPANPRQDGKTRLPFWGRWFAIGKPERASALFPAHSLRQAMRDSRETNRPPHGRMEKLASPFGGGGLQQASRRGQKSPHTGYTGPFVEKGKSFFAFPGQHFPFGPLCGTMSRGHNARATHSAGGLLLPAVSGQARADDRQR